MKLFTKLALVSAIAVSGSAMAMESLDDSALSAATGQDGINLGIAVSKIAIENLYIHDNDGYNASGDAGAIAISGNGITGDKNELDGLVIEANTASLLENNAGFVDHNLANVVIDTDGNGGDAFLNIGAKVSGLKIAIGEISVAQSNAVQATGAVRGVAAGKSAILSGLTLTTGVTTANIQLGNTVQGAMIKLNGAMQGGLKISNLGIIDNGADGGGQITIDQLTVADHGGANLSLNADVNVTPDGLKITAGATATDLYIAGLNLSGTGSHLTNNFVADSLVNGTQKSIGDIEVSNMRTWNGAAGMTPGSAANGAVIYVSGH